MDKVKSKEEIISEVFDRDEFCMADIPIMDYQKDAVYAAMETYATQQSRIDAIGFAEWVDANYWRMDMFHNSNLWYDKKDMFKDTTYTTEQLYELYLLSINKK